MKYLFLIVLMSFSAFATKIKHSERVGLIETCVLEEDGWTTSEYSAICEYRSKKSTVRSCAMARGLHYAFTIDCALYDEVNPKK